VEEVHEQPPLDIKDSQVVVVTETLENLKSNKQFQVRPKYLKKALHWLVINNELYKDVEILERKAEYYDLNGIFLSPDKSKNVDDLPSSIRSNTTSECILFIIYRYLKIFIIM